MKKMTENIEELEANIYLICFIIFSPESHQCSSMVSSRILVHHFGLTSTSLYYFHPGLGDHGILPSDLGEDAVAAVKANAMERLKSIRLSSMKSGLGEAARVGRSGSSSLGPEGGKSSVMLVHLGGVRLVDKASVVPKDTHGESSDSGHLTMTTSPEASDSGHVVLACMEQEVPEPEEAEEADMDSKWGASWFDQVLNIGWDCNMHGICVRAAFICKSMFCQKYFLYLYVLYICISFMYIYIPYLGSPIFAWQVQILTTRSLKTRRFSALSIQR